MAGLADLFGGSDSAFGGGALYGDMLSPAQKQALAWRGLMSAAGALGQAAMPSRMPVPLGAALGQAAGAMATGQDEAAMNALRATLLGQQAQQIKQKNDFVNKLFGNLPGLLGTVTGTDAAPAVPQARAAPTAALTGTDTIEPPSAIAAPDLGDGIRAGGALTSDPRGLVPYIRETAQKYGIDPNIAVRVAASEGLANPVGDGGKSGGAFQLYTGGGEGNRFQRETGLNPLDPQNEKQTIDFALRRAAQVGWGPWHGAAKIGVGPQEGIGGGAAMPQMAQATTQQTAPFGSLAPQTISPQALNTIVGLGVAGDLFGVPSLGNLLTGTPQYKAAIESATRGAGLPYDVYVKNLEATNALRNQLAGKGMTMTPQGTVAPIGGFNTAAGATAAAEEAGKQSASLPADMQRKLYETQLGVASASNQPVTTSPGQTVNVNPYRFPLPQPPTAIAPQQQAQVAMPLQQAQAAPAAPQAVPAGPGGPQMLPGGALQFQGEDVNKQALGKAVGEKAASDLFARRDVALDAVKSIDNANIAKELLDKGVITGAGADWKLQAGKALQLAGVHYFDDPIANTEAFAASQARAVGNIIKTFGSGSGISDADREYAAKIVGGQIALTEQSIRKILDINDRVTRTAIERFNKDASKVSPGLTPYPLTIDAPAPYRPQQQNQSPAAPKVLKYNPATGRLE